MTSKSSKWYIAELVVEHRIEGIDRNVVHTNGILISAENDEDAYRKALEEWKKQPDEF